MSEVIRPKNSIFDNPWTLLYKTAQLNNLASTQLFLNSLPDVPKNSVTYYPIINQIKDNYAKGWNLTQTYQYIYESDSNISLDAFVAEFIRFKNSNESMTDEFVKSELYQLSHFIKETQKLNTQLLDYAYVLKLAESKHDDFEFIKQQEKIIFTDIITVQNKYEQTTKIRKMFRSDIEETSVIYEISDITWENQIPTPEMGDLLFTSIECSKHIPSIMYIDDKGQHRYKVFRGKELDRDPPYDIIIPKPIKLHKNIIYLNLWLGDPDDSNPDLIYKPSKESFRLVTYNLEKNNMVASIPLIIRGEDKHANDTIFRNRISAAMRNFNLAKFDQVKRVAEVKLLPIPTFFPNSHIEDHTFLHLILNNILFYNCLYVEEVTNPFPLKSKMHLRYRPPFSDINRSRKESFSLYISNPSTVSFSLKRRVVNEPQTVRLENGSDEILPNEYVYYQIGISQSESIEEIENFLINFSAILTIYLSRNPIAQLSYIDNIFRDPYFAQTNDGVSSILAYFYQMIIQKSNFLSFEDMVKIFNNMFPQFPFEQLPNEIKQKFSEIETDFATEQEIFNLTNLYHQIMPLLNGISSKTEPLPGSEEKVSNRKITRLGNQFPEIFKPGYASLGSEIPEIIPLTDVDAETKKNKIEQESFMSPGGVRNRTVLRFPRDDPKFYFHCPNLSHPFPGVRENRLINKDKYPLVPICFSEDQMRRETRTKRYYEGNKDDIERGASIVKYHPAAENVTVRLSPTLRDVFALRQNIDITDLRRISVINSDDSDSNIFLHCILFALKEPNYINLDDTVKRKRYVSSLRQKLSQSINISLLRQELYDLSDEEILANLNDDVKFLDPRLYYRMIEEIYNVNIFVFSQNRDSVDSIETPRHRYMHIRPNRTGRSSIILVKYWGNRNISKINHPYCDLIVEVDKVNNQMLNRLFDSESDIGNICYETLIRTTKNTTWTYFNEFNIYLNMYNQINYYATFDIDNNKTPIIAQYIDDYGKTRGIIISVSVGNSLNNLTLLIPPTQPFNVPVVELNTMPLVHYTLANQILDEKNVTGVHQVEGYIIGLWYRMVDIKYHMYVPIIPTSTQITSKITNQPIRPGPLPPINLKNQYNIIAGEQRPTTPSASSFVQAPTVTIQKNEVSVQRIIYLKKILSITLQLMQWVFNIQRYEKVLRGGNDQPDDIEIFIGRSFSDVFVNYEYNYTNLGPLLPIINFTNDPVSPHDQAMVHIERNCNLVKNGRFVFNNPSMFEKFADEMRRYYRHNYDIDVTLIRNIKNYYTSSDEFTSRRDREIGVEIFISEKELTMWLKHRITANLPIIILRKLNPTLAYEETPIIYEDDDDKIYIIQNVNTGSFRQVMDVVKKWMNKRQNRGYNYVSKKRVAEDEKLRLMNQNPITLSHKIFAISVAGHLEVIEDNSMGQPNFLSVLTYAVVSPGFIPVNKYAAILQLL